MLTHLVEVIDVFPFIPDVKAQIEGDLIVATPGRVKFSAGFPDSLRQWLLWLPPLLRNEQAAEGSRAAADRLVTPPAN